MVILRSGRLVFFRRCALGFLCAVIGMAGLASHADASIILASSYNTPSGIGSEVGPFELAQQVTLTSLVTIASIDEALAHSLGPANGPASGFGLVLTIVNDVANTPGSTVLATDTGVSGTINLVPGFDDINFTFGSATLSPGTYWLVLKSLSGMAVQWEYQTHGTANASGPGGQIDSLSYVSSIPAYSSDVFMTTINGTVGAAPEPSTVFTCLGALAAMGSIRTRRRRVSEISDRPKSALS